jgi:hypothetical protein
VFLRWLCLALFLFAPALVTAQTAAPHPQSQPRAPASAVPANAQLPIRRVVLYKNGVGYFELSGHVTGNQTVTLDFSSSQLNDVLQSLTALDLNGGRIDGVDYNSSAPLSQQLRNLPLGLGGKPDPYQLYAALRGAEVEVSIPGQAAVTGRILHYGPTTEKTANGGTIRHRMLTVITEDADIRTFELGPSASVRVLDGDLRRDLNDYLQLLAGAQNQHIRHLTLQAQGTGSREIRVCYISEVPVWKSTYRIVFPPSSSDAAADPDHPETAILQGWAVIDNTGGSDWKDVQLSLVAGAPQSFIEPLSQPIYSQRPTVPVPESTSLAPTVHESGEMQNGALSEIAPSTAAVNVQAAPQMIPFQRGAYAMGRGIGDGYGGGVMSGLAPAPPPLLQDESASASASGFDDFFEYKIAQPVTLLRNQSALVPFLQTNVEAQRVTLWSATSPVPLRALWLTNSSGLTLDRGSFSVFENGEFAGEGLTDPIHSGEKRLLSYAVDDSVHVSVRDVSDEGSLEHLAVHNGMLTESTEETRKRTYVIRSAAADPRIVVLEHPFEDGWKLDSQMKPVEVTPSSYRFRLVVAPGDTVQVPIRETHTDQTLYELAAMGGDQLDALLSGGDSSALRKALAPVVAARTRVHDLESQIAAKQSQIQSVEADSTRLAGNLRSLKDTDVERALARRYAGEMNADEDQLQTLRSDLASLRQQRTDAQKALDQAISSLDLDEDL